MLQSPSNQRRRLSEELDQLEAKIAEVRVLYEQYFVDILPLPPDKLNKEVVMLIRQMLKAPFKNSADKFRLRTLVSRYQTYHTYWTRVQKQREEGTYMKDVFKADLREKIVEEAKLDSSLAGAAEKGLRQLYSTYEKALKKTGNNAGNVNFDSFKKAMLKKAKALKAQHGSQKLQYKVIVKGGKVVIKASPKAPKTT